MKKVTRVHGDIIFRIMKLYTGLSYYGGRHSGGGGDWVEAPGSVKTI